MAIRDKIAANAQPHLQPGETIRAVLMAQTASQYLMLVGYLPFLLMNRFRTVIATDRRIIVCDSGSWSGTKANSVVTELPRGQKLGPWTGNIWHKVQVGDETLRIHRRFKKDIEAVDR
jgi:hypothetical protein